MVKVATTKAQRKLFNHRSMKQSWTTLMWQHTAIR
jgi:hypothetical protein